MGQSSRISGEFSPFSSTETPSTKSSIWRGKKMQFEFTPNRLQMNLWKGDTQRIVVPVVVAHLGEPPAPLGRFVQLVLVIQRIRRFLLLVTTVGSCTFPADQHLQFAVLGIYGEMVPVHAFNCNRLTQAIEMQKSNAIRLNHLLKLFCV